MATKKKVINEYPKVVYVVVENGNEKYPFLYSDFAELADNYTDGQRVAIYTFAEVKTLKSGSPTLE